MKSSKNLIEKLKSFPYFSKDTIQQLNDRTGLGLKDSTIDTYISRSLKRKDIISLKNGLYISADFFDKNKSDVSYRYFLANILRKPSYVSSWTALQYYNLATEVIHTVISVSPKITRSYKTKIEAFSYQSIRKDLFSGFSLVKEKFDFFIALPSKALFDMLYFKTKQFKGLKLSDIDVLINESRVDIHEMSSEEQKKFYSLIRHQLS